MSIKAFVTSLASVDGAIKMKIMRNMIYVTIPVVYFHRQGQNNTDVTLSLAVRAARDYGISHIVVASTTGKTASKLHRLCSDEIQLVCVTHHTGFAQPGTNEMSAAMEKKLKAAGVPVLRTTHLLAGIDRALRLKFGGIGPTEVVAHTLRILGEGFKVAVEIAVMALDAGLIPFGKNVISVGGTGSGADTAIILRPAHANRFFDTRIIQIICKPFLGGINE